MVVSYTDDILKKIEQGRTVSGISYDEKQVPYKNFAHVFMEKVQQNPTHVFLKYIDEANRVQEYTYGDFYERVCQIANLLIHEFGIQKNDRVASVAFNHDMTVALMFACWMVGACYVPINVGEDDDRLTFVLNNANVKAVFAMPKQIERVHLLKGKFKTVEYFISFFGENDYEFLNLEDLLLDQPITFEGVDLATLDTEALIVYTSGTTGTPKGVLLQQYNCLVNAKEIVKWYDLNASDRAMLVLPIHHVNGIIVTLLTPLYAGASVVLNSKFSASNYWKIVHDEKCTYGSVVPTILSFLNEGETSTFVRPENRYFLICGAGPLTVDTAKKFTEKFHIKVNHGYGLSETTCYSCYLPFDLSSDDYKKWMQNYGYPSIGVVLPCNEMDIHDENGKTVAEGDKGEIVIRGHNVMSCYYGRPDANEEAFEFGWFKSGDEGFYKIDEKGRKFFFITGRLKELIIRGGVNYSPLEIDEVINAIDGIKAGMAVGFENDMYGEEIGAYVVLEKGVKLKEQSILDQCAVLPFSKRPKVIVLGDEFPVTSTGKYQRNKLKHLFKEWKSIQFKG